MFKAIITITMLASLSASAQNLERKADKLKIQSKTILVETMDVEPSENAIKPFTTVIGDLTGELKDLMNPLNQVDLILDKVINMGQKFWTILEKGRPVANYNQMTANALPQGVMDWTQMQGWAGKSLTQEMTATNGFGREQVKFVYKVIFTHSGNVNGIGKYIGYATIEPANLKIGWGGYTFNATVSVPQVFNMGTTQNPVAGMKIQVKYSVDTVLQHNEYTDSYIITGSGKIQAM